MWTRYLGPRLFSTCSHSDGRDRAGRREGCSKLVLPPTLPPIRTCRLPWKQKSPLSGGFSQLRGKDSNLDYLIQSQASYH
jgi:hypothetical protein